jgi:hypothetical protein
MVLEDCMRLLLSEGRRQKSQGDISRLGYVAQEKDLLWSFIVGKHLTCD